MNRVVPLAQTLALTLLLLCTFSRVNSQSLFTENGKLEAGIGIGPLFFLGDLGGSSGIGTTFIKDVDLPLTKISKSIYVNYYATEWLGFRLAFNHGVLQGSDAQAPNKGGAEVYRLQRNLSFKSTLIEGYAAAEVYPTVFFEKYDGLMGKFRPYGVIGVGAYHFNPKTQDDNGEWVKLQPLRTEGQGMAEYPNRKPYSLTQLEIPMGFGAKYYLSDRVFVGLEVLHRKLFTDYVDDVSTTYIDPIYFDSYLSPADAAVAKRVHYRSLNNGPISNPRLTPGEQRGDPKDNDAFFSTVIRFGFRLNSPNNPSNRARRQMRCPVFY